MSDRWYQLDGSHENQAIRPFDSKYPDFSDYHTNEPPVFFDAEMAKKSPTGPFTDPPTPNFSRYLDTREKPNIFWGFVVIALIIALVVIAFI